MKEFTQTNTDPGNCWQTALACILEVEPDLLPDQVALEKAKKDYRNALNAYLEHHHNLVYAELEDYQFAGIMPREPGWHLLGGPTVRTEPIRSVHHVVVGRYGEMVWDPHPSRAGLVSVKRWGTLGPLPDRLRAWRREMMAKGGQWDFDCVCPVCKPPV